MKNPVAVICVDHDKLSHVNQNCELFLADTVFLNCFVAVSSLNGTHSSCISATNSYSRTCSSCSCTGWIWSMIYFC